MLCHFVDEEHRTFRREAIIEMLHEQGVALYDTASVVRRLKNTASDKDLEVVETTDLTALARQLPRLETIVTTGEKATGLLAAHGVYLKQSCNAATLLGLALGLQHPRSFL